MARFKPSTGRTFGHSHTSVPGWDQAEGPQENEGHFSVLGATRSESSVQPHLSSTPG